MFDFIKEIGLDSFTMIFAVATLIPAVYSLLKTVSKSKRNYRETKTLYETIQRQQELDNIITVDNAISSLPEGITKEEYFSSLKAILSEINYNQFKTSSEHKKDDVIKNLITNHHEQAILQASVQFWFSLIASVVGFVFIITMILIANGSQWYEYVFKILPGAIIETVSVLFFKQSSETRERASDFLNRLRSDDQIAKSIIIVDTIEDEKLKSSVKAQIALHICGISELHNFSSENKD